MQGLLFTEALQEETPRGQKSQEGKRWIRTHQDRERWERKGVMLQDAVMYMAATNSTLHHHEDARDNPMIGIMANPDNGAVPAEIQQGRSWCTDNGAYSGRFNPAVYEQWLDGLMPYHRTCRFAVSPDVIGDWDRTLELFEVWKRKIRSRGLPAAIVLHRGCTPEILPDADALFIPASNLDDPLLPVLVKEARRRGMWVHLGRVNSLKRMQWAKRLGCDSADGTYLKHRGVDWGLQDVALWVWGSAAVTQNRSLLEETGGHPIQYTEMPSDHERLRERRREAAQAAGEELLDRTEVKVGMRVYDFACRQGAQVSEVNSPVPAEITLTFDDGREEERGVEQVCTLGCETHLQVILRALRTTGLDLERLDDLEGLDPLISMDSEERAEWFENRTWTREERERVDLMFVEDQLQLHQKHGSDPAEDHSLKEALCRLRLPLEGFMENPPSAQAGCGGVLFAAPLTCQGTAPPV